MSNNLKETGFIVIKENCCSNGFILDQEDSSITRYSDYIVVFILSILFIDVEYFTVDLNKTLKEYLNYLI